MTIGVKFSDSYKAKKLRIKKIPKMKKDLIEGLVKRDLIEIRKYFHDGIKDDTFRLERLADLTKDNKKSQGFPKPSAPLYGKGDESKDRSYMNMLVIQKAGKGAWKLIPSTKKHWSGKITLRHLHAIHEHGCKIVRGETIIQIKPRPALLLAYRRWLIKRRQADKSKEVRKALTQFVNKGNEKLLNKIKKFKDEK